jgi:hypothetical protein
MPFPGAESALSGVSGEGDGHVPLSAQSTPWHRERNPARRGPQLRNYGTQITEGLSSKKVQRSRQLVLNYAANHSFTVGLKAHQNRECPAKTPTSSRRTMGYAQKCTRTSYRPS